MRLLLTSAIALIAVSAFAADISNATVKDGDDLIISGQDFRLADIDAFETGQECKNGIACGAQAKAALVTIIGMQKITCKPQKVVDGRIIAHCYAGGTNVGTEMVRQGWALVRPDFAGSRAAALCAIEAEAASAKRGAWAYGFDLPYFQKGGRKKSASEVACPSFSATKNAQ